MDRIIAESLFTKTSLILHSCFIFLSFGLVTLYIKHTRHSMMKTLYHLSSLKQSFRSYIYSVADALTQFRLPYVAEALLMLLQGLVSCISALAFFVILISSKYFPLGIIPRYDFILIMAIVVQILLVITKQETLEELKTISYFHLLGLLLELFKCHPDIGSWSYPEFAYSKFFGVPLYSGFMYAAVASFILHFWRRCYLTIEGYQHPKAILWIAALIYINFFSHHFMGDFRWLLTAILLMLLWNTRIRFTVYKVRYHLPLLIGFLLLGGLIWVAENIATFYSAWQYPNQKGTWQLVHLGKINSWGLLVVMTFVIVSRFKLKQPAKCMTTV